MYITYVIFTSKSSGAVTGEQTHKSLLSRVHNILRGVSSTVLQPKGGFTTFAEIHRIISGFRLMCLKAAIHEETLFREKFPATMFFVYDTMFS